jgi:hypothetical protein
MSNTIILNSSNVIGINNSQFQYNFPQGSYTIPDGSEICVSQITIPYSWFNISASLGNNTFSYVMPTTASTTATKVITLSDGFYDIPALNKALQASLYANNYFFYNNALGSVATGTSNPSIIYPIQFVSNYSNYNNQIQFQYIPTSSTNVVNQFGTGWAWALGTYPTNAQTPQIIVPQQNGVNISGSTYGFGNIIGFTNATYPSATIYYGGSTTFSTNTPTLANSVPYSVSGNSLTSSPPFAPLGTSVNGLLVRCSIVENLVNANSDVMDCVPITSTFGSNINYSPISDNWVKVKQGKYQNIVITFCDQNYNLLKANDPNVLISLLVRFPPAKK